jgi:sulfur transfer protein SufE
MTRTESKKLNDVLDMFASVTDQDERAMLLIGYADRFHEMAPAIAHRPFAENHRVPYCESEAFVWVVPRPDGTAELAFAVENPSGISAKALAAILTETLSGSSPELIASVTPEIVADLFRENISMGKGMGLTGMVEMMRGLARQLATIQKGTHNP